MESGDVEKAARLSQSVLATQRMDDDVDAWITINGAHVPLDENGTAIGGAGGAFTGQNLSQAHAASKAASAERAAAKAAKAATATQQSSNSFKMTKVSSAMSEAEISKVPVVCREPDLQSYEKELLEEGNAYSFANRVLTYYPDICKSADFTFSDAVNRSRTRCEFNEGIYTLRDPDNNKIFFDTDLKFRGVKPY